MTTKRALHFQIHGDGLTRIVRDLWLEGSRSKALTVLVTGLHGIDELQALDVCVGRKKLVGDVHGMSLADDDTDIEPASLRGLFQQQENELKEKERLLADTRSALADVLADRELVGDVDLPLPPAPSRSPVDYGWLSRTGQFYECSYAEHSDLADRLSAQFPERQENPLLDGEQALEKRGWVKLTRSMDGGFVAMHGERAPTKDQQRALDAWIDLTHGSEISRE